MAKIFRPILNACGVALDNMDEICRLDGQVQRMLVDSASNIEAAMVNDGGNPPTRENGQNCGMLYLLYVDLQTQD